MSRLYLQAAPGAELREWPAERLRAELRTRLDEPCLEAGEILETGVTGPAGDYTGAATEG